MTEAASGGRRKVWMLSIRTTADLKGRLETAAEDAGRSVTQEVESRLTRTLDQEEVVGGAVTAAFLNLLGARIRDLEVRTGKSWHSDRFTWGAVRDAVINELDNHAPGTELRPSEALAQSAAEAAKQNDEKGVR